MTVSTYPATCLSDRPHDRRVSDVALHFSGCLPVNRRKQFFHDLPPEGQQRIARQNSRIAALRERLERSAAAPGGGEPSAAVARLGAFKAALREWRVAVGRPAPSAPAPSASPWPDDGDGEVDADVKASVICFRDGEPFDVPGVPGTFPSQSLTVRQLLAADPAHNPLMQPCPDGVVRYFHLPANNMVWVEEAVARYYGEDRPEPDDFLLKCQQRRSRTKTEMLLRPEVWQGQCSFDADSEVHARHMRPFCDVVSTNPVSTEPLPRNMVLFMPYLHWETDRGRVLSAECIKKVSKQTYSVSEVVDKAQGHWQDHPAGHGNHDGHQSHHGHWGRHDDDGATAAEAPLTRRQALGRLLLRAASLLEAMEFHVEERLTSRYLNARPPLHPRRTLDQSYYGALKSTGTRDRDQVVFRGTTPDAHDCVGADMCRQCRDDVKKVPRLIMVDQLWLWVLDENTVISSFPRRFGKNRPDPSAVHKNIRARLRQVRKDDISSAYDVALLIVDECSRVFFDRTKPSDRKPNLVELFADAIRGVTYKQTAAFDQFLVYSHLASSEYRQQMHVSPSTEGTLLNINPEGNLLKEIKDIMDEIHILTQIQDQQQAVMEGFIKNVRMALVPRIRASNNSDLPSPWDLALGSAAAAQGAEIGTFPGGGGAALLGREDAPLPLVDGDAVKLRKHRDRQKAKWTLARADHLLKEVHDRKAELRTLLANAKTTSSALKDLLTLKQQQAGVIEARESVMQGRLTLMQGQSIVVFTVVTIIFLPLSFFATIFGMNAAELNGGAWTFNEELVYMLPISAGIIIISFVLAFSHASHAFVNELTILAYTAVSFAYNTTMTWLAVRTGLYAVGLDMSLASSRLRDREHRLTATWKAEERRKKTKTRVERLQAANDAIAAVGISRADTASGILAAAGSRPTARAFSPYIVPSPSRGGAMKFPTSTTGSPSPVSPYPAVAVSNPAGQTRGGLGIAAAPGYFDVELGHWHGSGSGSSTAMRQ